MEAKFIDKDHGIVSVSLSQFRKDSQGIAFLYYPGRDWIIVNEDNADFDFWKEIVPIYVGFTDFQKKEFYHSDEMQRSTMVMKCIAVLNRIVRIRRKRGIAA